MDIARIALLKTRDDVLSLPWETFLPDSEETPAGIYMVLGMAGDILYIGQSVNIRARLRNGDHPIHSDGQLHAVKIFRVEDANLRGYCEHRFIELVAPRWNKRNGMMPNRMIPDEILQIAYNSVFPAPRP